MHVEKATSQSNHIHDKSANGAREDFRKDTLPRRFRTGRVSQQGWAQ
uniref:Uncharacterized protein n=1 Tax=Anopheles dirus TaxID=7168 RepID=A0A182N548_9DIPT